MAEPSRITLTGRKRCLGCWSQDTDRGYVDFGSAIDGPLEYNDLQGFYSHDDLILCEQCVRSAVAVLPASETVIEHLKRELADERAAVGQWKEYAEKIEDVVRKRPAPARRPPGRPRKEPTETPEVVAA